MSVSSTPRRCMTMAAVERKRGKACSVKPAAPPQEKDGTKARGKPEPKILTPTPTTVPVLRTVPIAVLE